MYNMCILHAPLIADPEEAVEGTGELALGFANRSAAFYHLNKHEECLKVRAGSRLANLICPSPFSFTAIFNCGSRQVQVLMYHILDYVRPHGVSEVAFTAGY